MTVIVIIIRIPNERTAIPQSRGRYCTALLPRDIEQAVCRKRALCFCYDMARHTALA